MTLKLNNKIVTKYTKSSEYLSNTVFGDAEISITAGSGIAQSFLPDDILFSIPYHEIPNFPTTSVEGHAGDLLLININGVKAMVFSGRFHLYEGIEVSETVSQIIVSYLLGLRNHIITNAAGALNEAYLPGDLMLISDTLNFTSRDLSSVFDSINFRQNISKQEKNLGIYKKLNAILTTIGINLKFGVYAAVIGPNYETRSEIRMFRRLGADAVGMSTVLELATADILEMNTIACSLITNTAKEIPQLVTHQEVMDLALKSRLDVREFIFAATKLLIR
ncbi:MAG: purine-nucleoside phosphorylase [Desulfobulbaceae bacterium]|nr:purine-nucleoside phosphorylase [Candidatus Kapabacteria bacterium]MBS4000376.1 purine-nucleoside phosphorylase [Desulfobulbaceae bacterium]